MPNIQPLNAACTHYNTRPNKNKRCHKYVCRCRIFLSGYLPSTEEFASSISFHFYRRDNNILVLCFYLDLPSCGTRSQQISPSSPSPINIQKNWWKLALYCVQWPQKWLIFIKPFPSFAIIWFCMTGSLSVCLPWTKLSRAVINQSLCCYHCFSLIPLKLCVC